jgi:AAA ATPase domain
LLARYPPCPWLIGLALLRPEGGTRIGLMPSARLPLVGRREEMAALEDEFARAAAGEFRVVMLSGEAGVGKSRLARELLARHADAAVPGAARGGPTGPEYHQRTRGDDHRTCEHGGTHISDDLLFVEPVDLAGRTVPPGDRSSKVYLTNLYNPVLPLIRYEITVLPGRCPCGSAHRRIADVQGRLDDEFIYEDLRVHPHLFRTALSREAGVVEDQVRQTPGGAAIAIRCTAPASVNGLRDRIATALASAGLDRPQVTVEVVDRFERPGGPAKLKRFLALDPAPGPLQSAR